MKSNILYALFLSIVAGTAFGVWPNIAGQSKVSSSWLVIFTGIVLILSGVIKKFISEGNVGWQMPDKNGCTVILIASIINAIGYAAYGPLIILSRQLGTTTFLAITVAVTVVIVYLYGVIFQKEVITTTKLIGVITVIAGMILIKIK